MELGCDGSPSAASFTYDVFGQQATATYNGATTAYTYNAQGIRVAKTTAGNRTDFLLDGGNVAAEQTDGEITTYLRGVNLIARSDGETTEYYLYNAHGDVVQRTDSTGAVTKTYTYDAFGVEQDKDSTDPNPFRYCGEYLDRETGTYYLRARYYAPETGRFTQEDTHWNPANRLYGDEPQKINERTDELGLKTYAYAPDITAVMQSGNLYAYCAGNPVMYRDVTGKFLGWAVGALVGAVCGGIGAAISGEDVVAGALGGAASGLITGAAADFLIVTGGSGIVVVAVSAAAGMAGAIADKMVVYVITGDIERDEVISAAIFGAVSGALGGLTEGAITSLAELAKQKGKDVGRMAYNMLKKEICEMPENIAAEFLSNMLSWLIELGYCVSEEMIYEAFYDGVL